MYEFSPADRRRLQSELQEFIRIPSVSGDPARAEDVKRCAHWLAGRLDRAGLRVRVFSTPGHPIVVGQWLGAPGAPTLLAYGHYDVQPAHESDGWSSPPFGAELRDGFIWGRGASDDKGQLFTHIAAIRAVLRRGPLPINVKCVFEGEEEIGSRNFAAFISRHRDALRSDVAVVSDTSMATPDQPALTFSLRGQLALELELRGPDHDLHSGSYGGVVHDPLQALCEIVAALHDRNGRIAVPGFYDAVQGLRLASDIGGVRESELQRQTGVPRTWGEQGYNAAERLAVRPSLSVTGIAGGHSGPGPKSVIPARAVAKLSFRLVPDQEPRETERLVRRHLQCLTPPTVHLRVRTQLSARPALTDPRHPAIKAAARACVRGFGRAPVLLRSGGSIPAVSDIQRLLGIPVILMGFGSAEDGAHSSNEKFALRTFYRGIVTSAAFLHELGQTLGRTAAGKKRLAPSLL